jgi:hypothetical protein
VLSREIFGDAEIFGEKTPSEIAMDLFPGVPPFEVLLGISGAVGHLEILTEGRSVKVKEEGRERLLFARSLKKANHFAQEKGTYDYLEKLTNPLVSKIGQLFLF